MPTLHLGVIESKYANNDKSVGTGDVANILEKHYGVLTGFAVTHDQTMADMLAESYAGSLETIMMGGPISDPAAGAMSKISSKMKTYISSQEAERVLAPGVKKYPVPTEAALLGITHRFKDPTLGTSKNKRKLGRYGARRPSFRDTGLYESSLTAWMD